jgi:hypothetical protein
MLSSSKVLLDAFTKSPADIECQDRPQEDPFAFQLVRQWCEKPGDNSS